MIEADLAVANGIVNQTSCKPAAQAALLECILPQVDGKLSMLQKDGTYADEDEDEDEDEDDEEDHSSHSHPAMRAMATMKKSLLSRGLSFVQKAHKNHHKHHHKRHHKRHHRSHYKKHFTSALQLEERNKT